MADHHYVPKFLLRKWATRGLFPGYYWDQELGRVIENRRCSVKSSCQIKDLNVFKNVKPEYREWLETDYLTPRVDSPAARVHVKMLTHDIQALTWQDQCDWARLLVAFGMRMPEMLLYHGPTRTRDALLSGQTPLDFASEDEQEADLYIQANMETLTHNMPRRAAAHLIEDPARWLEIISMEWWIRRWRRKIILIGDRPLMTYPSMDHPCGIPLNHPGCLIVLPIAPDAVFFACAHERTRRKVCREGLTKLARRVNDETIRRASRTVIAANTDLRAFVVPRMYRHQSQYPAIEGV
jgi:hypothetical protein